MFSEFKRQAHLAQCCAIAEKRRRYGYTLADDCIVSEALAQVYPLDLPTDDELTERLCEGLRRLLNDANKMVWIEPIAIETKTDDGGSVDLKQRTMARSVHVIG